MLEFNAAICLAAVLALSNCATPAPHLNGVPSNLIAEKSAIAAGAQRDYAALVAEDYSTVQKRQTAFESDVIDIDYIGSPKELVESIASRYGMNFSEVGRPIDLRPLNIRMKAVTPDALLRNVGNQIHSGADIFFDKQKKSVAIEYKSCDTEQYPRKGGLVVMAVDVPINLEQVQAYY